MARGGPFGDKTRSATSTQGEEREAEHEMSGRDIISFDKKSGALQPKA